MGSLQQRLYPNPLKSIDSASFTGSYQTLGIPLENACRIIKLTNNSTVLVTVSWDGINDHEILPPGSFVLLDASANKENSGVCEISQGTQFLVKGAAATGLVYLSSYFTR